jgi:nitrate reductase gamma subunit
LSNSTQKSTTGRKRFALAMIIIGTICFVIAFAEGFIFASYCTRSAYCENLYSIPEIEIGIFGGVLLFAGVAVLILSSNFTKRRAI